MGVMFTGLRQGRQRLDEWDTGLDQCRRLAGCQRKVFSDAALYLIYKISEGVPRRINNLCDLCLLEGAEQKVETITEAVVKQAL